jgi:hypothetical protein
LPEQTHFSPLNILQVDELRGSLVIPVDGNDVSNTVDFLDVAFFEAAFFAPVAVSVFFAAALVMVLLSLLLLLSLVKSSSSIASSSPLTSSSLSSYSLLLVSSLSSLPSSSREGET